MHAQGAMLCSACSGVLLLAETGLLDGREATIHWAYARTFGRSFPKVRLRLEEAKRRLERTDAPIDEISWNVGYEDPAFFRRLFKRTTRITPGAYRRKFRLPDFAATEKRAS